jgi:hypothetical protein
MQAEGSSLLVTAVFQLHNKQGLHDVCRAGNAIRVIETRTMKRARHVACGIYGREDKCVQSSVGKPEGSLATWQQFCPIHSPCPDWLYTIIAPTKHTQVYLTVIHIIVCYTFRPNTWPSSGRQSTKFRYMEVTFLKCKKLYACGLVPILQ